MDETVRLPRDLGAEARAARARILDDEAQTIMEAAREVFGIGIERVSEGGRVHPDDVEAARIVSQGLGFGLLAIVVGIVAVAIIAAFP